MQEDTGLVSEAHRANLLQWCLQALQKQTAAEGCSLLMPAIASWCSRLDDLESLCTRKILFSIPAFFRWRTCPESQRNMPTGFLTPGTIFYSLTP